MINHIHDYLSAQYEDGARGPDKFDCWGLVRDARYRILGKPLMESWGLVRNDQLREFTEAFKVERSAGFERCEAEHGAIACAFRGEWVYHIAIVFSIDSRLMVLEIRNRFGVTLTPLADFERRCRCVEYYRDR